MAEKQPMRCSFCGRDQHEVTKLIAGPGVYICAACVALCVEVLEQENPVRTT